jgi:hypothetical protein
MEKTQEMLASIEMMLLQADLRVRMMNGELNGETIENNADIFKLQIELEKIHNLTTAFENTLLTKINCIITKRLKNLTEN